MNADAAIRSAYCTGSLRRGEARHARSARRRARAMRGRIIGWSVASRPGAAEQSPQPARLGRRAPAARALGQLAARESAAGAARVYQSVGSRSPGSVLVGGRDAGAQPGRAALHVVRVGRDVVHEPRAHELVGGLAHLRPNRPASDPALTDAQRRRARRAAARRSMSSWNIGERSGCASSTRKPRSWRSNSSSSKNADALDVRALDQQRRAAGERERRRAPSVRQSAARATEISAPGRTASAMPARASATFSSPTRAR